MAISDETRQNRENVRALRAAEKAERRAKMQRDRAYKEYKKAERRAKNGNKQSIARAERMREKLENVREIAKQKTRERRAAEKPIKQAAKRVQKERERAESGKTAKGRIFTPKPKTGGKTEIVYGETPLKTLKDELRKMQAKVNRLYKDLRWYAETHKDTLDSPAVKFLDDTGGLISTAGNDYIHLYGEFLRAKQFLDNPLSNMENYKKWLEEIYNKDSDFGQFIDSGLDDESETYEEERNERIELYYDLYEKLCEMFPPFESDNDGHMKLSELINAGYDYNTILDTMIDYCTDAYKNDYIYSTHMNDFV